MGRKPGEAARMPTKRETELTPEQKIVALRGLRANRLFVTDMTQVDALLKACDALAKAHGEALKTIVDQAERITKLQQPYSTQTGSAPPESVTGRFDGHLRAAAAPLDRCGACGQPDEKHMLGNHDFVPNTIA